MATMYITILDRKGKRHEIEMLFMSVDAARAARDQMLPLVNWLMREAAILWYNIRIE